ncbi:MAG: hypothetical protein SOZ30_07585, partial [Roseburia lenta]|nr:hypothetical protein [Roseburia lenta]
LSFCKSKMRSFGLGAGTDQQADRAQDAGAKTVAEHGVSDEKLFLSLIKTVFAKFDNRLG